MPWACAVRSDRDPVAGPARHRRRQVAQGAKSRELDARGVEDDSPCCRRRWLRSEPRAERISCHRTPDVEVNGRPGGPARAEEDGGREEGGGGKAQVPDMVTHSVGIPPHSNQSDTNLQTFRWRLQTRSVLYGAIAPV